MCAWPHHCSKQARTRPAPPAASPSSSSVRTAASRALKGSLVRHLQLEPFGGVGGVVLSAPLARTVGVVKFGREVTLQVDGRATRAPLYETLSERSVGALAQSPIVLAPLFFAQEMTGLQGRVSRILVTPDPGAQARVRTALEALAAGRLNVEGIDYEERLFAKAAAASSQSTELFSVISALVGFLFRLQRDAAHRPAAPASDRRAASRRLRPPHGDRGAGAGRARARGGRVRAGTGARRGALDSPLSGPAGVLLARVSRPAPSAS